MYSASDLKKGLKIEIDGQPWVITEFEFCKPGKGTALYRCRLKNLMTGAGMDRTFRPVDKVDEHIALCVVVDLSTACLSVSRQRSHLVKCCTVYADRHIIPPVK